MTPVKEPSRDLPRPPERVAEGSEIIPLGGALLADWIDGQGAVVGNERGEILLVQRVDSGVWLYPTGWADVGYSPSEIALKEVEEETGIECEVLRPIAVLDGMRLGFTHVPLYSIVFHCRATGGELAGHPLETDGVGWFGRDELPPNTAGATWWAPMAFAAIDGEPMVTTFDSVREPIWRSTGH